MSLAAETREAVRARPYLLQGLRAGVINYAAAARALDVADDTEAVATALRRFRETLADRETTSREARVTMEGGIEPNGDGGFFGVDGVGYHPGDGSLTAIHLDGDVDARVLTHVLGVLAANGVDVVAAGAADSALVVVVDRRDGPEALRRTEAALEAVPTKTTV